MPPKMNKVQWLFCGIHYHGNHVTNNRGMVVPGN
jgi:hypothetical protein